MRNAYALRLGVAASLVLALAGCGPAGGEWAAQPSAVKVKPSKNCLAAEPIDLGAGVVTIVGDSTDASNRPDWCGEGPASYYTFTVGVTSALYVDTAGSSFDAVVGLLAGGCASAPVSCSGDACGSALTELVQVVAPGTYHLLVTGRTSEDRGPFVVHAQLTPLLDLSTGVATVAGDSGDTGNRSIWCGEGPASYFTFTVPRASVLYVDTIGSSFDTIVGVLPEGCYTPSVSCADDACGSSQTQLVQVVQPGTYHLVVAGRTAEDRGPFVVHAQLARLDRAGMPAGEVPRGAFVLTGALSSFQGGWLGDCGRGPFVWYWYASCPGEAGLFTASTANAGTTFDAALSFVDVDDDVEICCDAGASGPNVVCSGDGLEEFPAQAAIEIVDEDEAGLHVLKVGAPGVMTVPEGEFQVIGYRP